MVMVEGTKINAKRIQGSNLAKAWKILSRRPLPKIKALRLSDEDFDSVIKQRRCFEDDLRELEEWGTVLSTKGTDACVFNANEEDAQYIILIREKPFHKIEEIIFHELSHIARGDL